MLSLEKNYKKDNSIALSIDLEDFSFDIARSYGLKTKTNKFALDKCYEVIKKYLDKNLRNTKITFFSTGSLAREYPELLSRIFQDGHEIASHYNHHDLMTGQSLEEIEDNLGIAKESIKLAVGDDPLGFRAPAFSIKPDNYDVFNLIGKYFKYDSSCVVHSNELDKFKKHFYKNISTELIELPIVSSKYLFINIKSGGTFFRLFPYSFTKKVIEHNLENGFLPQVYLHPYDLLTDFEFGLSFNELKGINFYQRLTKYLRQYQWLSLNNKSTLSKLKLLSKEYSHIGTIRSHIGI